MKRLQGPTTVNCVVCRTPLTFHDSIDESGGKWHNSVAYCSKCYHLTVAESSDPIGEAYSEEPMGDVADFYYKQFGGDALLAMAVKYILQSKRKDAKGAAKDLVAAMDLLSYYMESRK